MPLSTGMIMAIAIVGVVLALLLRKRKTQIKGKLFIVPFLLKPTKFTPTQKFAF